MSRRRVRAIFRRVVAEIRRDRPSLALLFIVPIIMSGRGAYILREGATPDIQAVVVAPAGTPAAVMGQLVGTAISDGGGTVTAVPDEAAARAAIADGTATVAILLPADIGSGGPSTITIVTDGLDPAGEATQASAVQKSLLAAIGSVAGSAMPTVAHETLYGTPSDDPITAFAPAILAFFAYFFVYILTGVSFLRERTGGTLERLMATPVTRGEVVLGYTLGFGLFATIQVIILLTWTLGSLEVPAIGPLPTFSVGLGVPTAGSPLTAFVVILLTAVGAVSLGVFLSTFARTELQIIQFVPIVIIPQFLLSGVLFPVSSLPAVLQPVAKLMPMTYAVDGLRQVFVAGADLAVRALQVDLVILAAVALFFGAIAALTIRRDVV